VLKNFENLKIRKKIFTLKCFSFTPRSMCFLAIVSNMFFNCPSSSMLSMMNFNAFLRKSGMRREIPCQKYRLHHNARLYFHLFGTP
jgi:hypothetical protein